MVFENQSLNLPPTDASRETGREIATGTKTPYGRKEGKKIMPCEVIKRAEEKGKAGRPDKT